MMRSLMKRTCTILTQMEMTNDEQLVSSIKIKI